MVYKIHLQNNINMNISRTVLYSFNANNNIKQLCRVGCQQVN